jgi:hypothetical protein
MEFFFPIGECPHGVTAAEPAVATISLFGRMPSPMAFPRGRTSKPKSRPDASPRKFSQKSKAEDTEEDSQQPGEDVEKDEHIDSNDAGNTRIQLDRQSILRVEFCTDYEAASRKRQAKKQTPLLDLLDDPQLEVLKVLFPSGVCQ